MSSTTSTLAAGVQTLYDSNLLSKNVSQQTLDSASTSQLNQLANSAAAQQQIDALLGNGNSDSVVLSPEAASTPLLQDNSSDDVAAPADFFTQAVSNQLTNNLNNAVNAFLPATSTQTGHHINVVG